MANKLEILKQMDISRIKRTNELLDEADKIFDNPLYSEVLQDYVKATISRKYVNLEMPQIVVYDKNDGSTACTNGNVVKLNLQTPLLRALNQDKSDVVNSYAYKKHMIEIGQAFHECGHLLYTDFILGSMMLSEWYTGNFYGRVDKNKHYSVVTDFLDNHPSAINTFAVLAKIASNILEDMYIERCLLTDFKGVTSDALRFTRNSLAQITEPLSIPDDPSKTMTRTSSALSAMLFHCFGFKIEATNEFKQTDVYSDLMHFIRLIQPYIDKLSSTISRMERCRYLNNVMVELCYLMMIDYKEMSDTNTQDSNYGNQGDASDTQRQSNQNNENTKSSANKNIQNASNSNEAECDSDNASSNENGYSNEIDENDDIIKADVKNFENEINSSVKQASDSLKIAKMPTHCKNISNNQAEKPQIDSDQDKQEIGNQSQIEMSENDEKDVSEGLKQLANEIAKKETTDKAAKKEMDEMKSAASDIEKNLKSKSRVYNVAPGKICSDSRELDFLDAKVSKTAAVTSRKIKNILKLRNEGGMLDGFYSGRTFNASSVWKGNYKYFSQDIIPDNQPDVVFGIRVDCSGSMAGTKLNHAKQACLLVKKVCDECQIPYMIIGDEHGDRDNIKIISPFNDIDKKGDLRIAGMETGGCTADGLSVTYLAEQLLKRNEEKKVLISISDGCPNEAGLFSGSPTKDLELALKEYRKKKITCFGLFIENSRSDLEKIKELYGENYTLDCSDLDKFPDQMVKLVKRYVLK